VSKVTLADTSIDGPAFVVGSSHPGLFVVLAWTGRDAAHHLNLMISSDGVHFGNKRTLNETAFAHPAVAETDDGRVVLAWTGTDAHHSLNILFDALGAGPKKVTLLDENSFASPGIQVQGGLLVLSWAGTDANHSLNSLTFGIAAGLAPGTKVTLPNQFNSEVGPGLGTDVTGAQFASETAPLLLTFSFGTPMSLMDALISFDGSKWLTIPQAFATAFPNGPPAHADFPREFSAATSSMEGFVLNVTGDGQAPLLVLAWTGIDAAHSVNVWADVFGLSGSPQKLTLTETALGGPGVGGNVFTPASEFLVAWTGTDAQHHLNVALLAA
jgi:hypothetical protein